MKCERCVTDNTQCIHCIDNPIYAHIPKTSKFTWYKPVCLHGYTDCIYDPSYMKITSPKWYEQLYGNLTPEEAAQKFCTEENCYYDNEDK